MKPTTNPNAGRPMGENALARAVRLLKRLNERIADPDVADMNDIGIVINAAGHCRIETESVILAEFSNADEMLSFLEAPLATQVKVISVN